MKSAIKSTAALLTIISWALTNPACYGQVRALEKGSAAEIEFSQEFRARQARMAAALKAEQEANAAAMAAGKDLFGVDERWTDGTQGKGESEFGGTLLHKTGQFRIGDWGCANLIFTVIQKIKDDTLLVSYPGGTDNVAMVLRGLDCSKVADGAQFILQRPLAITETYSYKAVSGAKKTVLVMEGNAEKADAVIAEEVKKVKEKLQAMKDAGYRTWTDSTGKVSFVAKFVSSKSGKAKLEKEDGSTVEGQISKLCKEDQQYVRDEIKRRAADRK